MTTCPNHHFMLADGVHWVDSPNLSKQAAANATKH